MYSLTSTYARKAIPLVIMLFAACCTSVSAVDAWPIDEPQVVQATLGTDVIMYDLAWAKHDEEAVDLLAGEIITQIASQTGYVLIDIPQLKQEWDARAVRSQRGRLTDMNGERIKRRHLTKVARKYGTKFEQVVTELTSRIQDARPGIHFAFVGIEPTTKGRKRSRDTNLYEIVPGFHLLDTVSWNGQDSSLRSALRNSMDRRSFELLARDEIPFSFKTADDQWFLSSFGDLDPQIITAVFPVVAPTLVDVPNDEPGGQQQPSAPGPPIASGPPLPQTPAPQGGSEPEPQEEITHIDFPTRADEPYGSQHGRVRVEDIVLHPAKYQRRTTPFVGITLSHGNAARNNPVNNPRGWVHRYRDLPDVGFDSPNLNYDMEALYELGVREVWFWEWSGQHAFPNPRAETMMAWFTPEVHTPIMRETWPQFVSRWQARGMRFGFWLGAISFPNMGTAEAPEHMPIMREYFDFIADTIAQIKAEGFDAVGLDAYTWILSQRDSPEWANWSPNQHGPRDKGIGLALLRMLNTDPRLNGMHFTTEARIPFGEHLAEAGTLKAVTNRGDSNPRSRPTVDTLERPVFEDIVNPGHEITMLVMDAGSAPDWTISEFTLLLARLGQYGYRTGINIQVLKEIDAIDDRGNVLNDISSILNP